MLSGFEEIAVCVAYRLPDGTETTEFPGELGCLDAVEPVYRSFPGWQEDITGARSLADLPETCRAYVAFLEEQMGTPIITLSVGPGRDQLFDCVPAGATA